MRVTVFLLFIILISITVNCSGLSEQEKIEQENVAIRLLKLELGETNGWIGPVAVFDTLYYTICYFDSYKIDSAKVHRNRSGQHGIFCNPDSWDYFKCYVKVFVSFENTDSTYQLSCGVFPNKLTYDPPVLYSWKEIPRWID